MMKLFESSDIILLRNMNDDLFIFNKHTKVRIRVHIEKTSTHITADEGIFIPWSFNGLPGFRVETFSSE